VTKLGSGSIPAGLTEESSKLTQQEKDFIAKGIAAQLIANYLGIENPEPIASPRVLRLVSAKGTADMEDVNLVASELEKLPPNMIQELEDNKIKTIVCRNSVTEYAVDLRGVQVPGYEKGFTYDMLPGVGGMIRKISGRTVISTVIATKRNQKGMRYIPPYTEGHGAYNLVLHETLHSIDAALHKSSSPDFQKALNADVGRLGDYEKTNIEAYAETGARYFDGDPHLAELNPNLQNYWNSVQLMP
jgi:hypothetical protein